MTILLDTQLLLWSQGEPDRIPQWLKDELDAPNYTPLFSTLSIWEVVIKASLNKPGFDYDPHDVHRALVGLGWQELGLTAVHVLAVSQLPPHHSDPFDRALVAQAKAEGLIFVTADKALQDYGSHVRVI
jgi:PIN domain nuclease of toxin-antitoxin system